MTVLYPQVAHWSTLVPNQWDPEWTRTDQVLSDLPPGAAGVGAVVTATQALNLSVADAAHLVASQGGTNLPVANLVQQATRAINAQAMGLAAGMQGSYGGRIPIASTVNTAVALLAGDSARVSLIIQNNNAAGGAILLVSIDGAIDTGNPAFYMNLAPGEGITQPQNAWTNPIYVAWASGTVAGGVIFYGSIATPNLASQPSALGVAVGQRPGFGVTF